eukprot:Hpha_TRINITY_DN22781_c0_g1::TRINITY_DN22781_c0_g1_i1::g.34211::m.34211
MLRPGMAGRAPPPMSMPPAPLKCPDQDMRLFEAIVTQRYALLERRKKYWRLGFATTLVVTVSVVCIELLTQTFGGEIPSYASAIMTWSMPWLITAIASQLACVHLLFPILDGSEYTALFNEGSQFLGFAFDSGRGCITFLGKQAGGHTDTSPNSPVSGISTPHTAMCLSPIPSPRSDTFDQRDLTDAMRRRTTHPGGVSGPTGSQITAVSGGSHFVPRPFPSLSPVGTGPDGVVTEFPGATRNTPPL